MWFVGVPLAAEKFQAHALLRVVVLDGFEEFADHDFDAEFLAQFADERDFKGFARFHFAAGKFPQPAEVRVCVALGDKELARAEDKSGADVDD